MTSDFCRCRKLGEHLIYLLIECTEYASERLVLREELRELPLNFRLMLNTTIGIAATTKFLAKTGITTLKWHVTRVEEEKEEEEEEEEGELERELEGELEGEEEG